MNIKIRDKRYEKQYLYFIGFLVCKKILEDFLVYRPQNRNLYKLNIKLYLCGIKIYA